MSILKEFLSQHLSDSTWFAIAYYSAVNINNTYYTTGLDVYINDLGDVEIMNHNPLLGWPAIGYGVDLGLDEQVQNNTILQAANLLICDENTQNLISNQYVDQNYNVFLSISASGGYSLEEVEALAGPMKDDIERVLRFD